MKKFLRVLFNIFWIIVVGIELAFSYICAGVCSCITIIPIFFGIPKIYFKAIPLAFSPAGKKVTLHFGEAPVRNVFYLILGGAWTFIGMYVFGAILCACIVFIPLGLQVFKFAKYFIAPFGAEVEKIDK